MNDHFTPLSLMNRKQGFSSYPSLHQNCTAPGGMSNMEGSNCCPLNGEPSMSQPFFSISCTFCEQKYCVNKHEAFLLTKSTAPSRGRNWAPLWLCWFDGSCVCGCHNYVIFYLENIICLLKHDEFKLLRRFFSYQISLKVRFYPSWCSEEKKKQLKFEFITTVPIRPTQWTNDWPSWHHLGLCSESRKHSSLMFVKITQIITFYPL